MKTYVNAHVCHVSLAQIKKIPRVFSECGKGDGTAALEQLCALDSWGPRCALGSPLELPSTFLRCYREPILPVTVLPLPKSVLKSVFRSLLSVVRTVFLAAQERMLCVFTSCARRLRDLEREKKSVFTFTFHSKCSQSETIGAGKFK